MSETTRYIFTQSIIDLGYTTSTAEEMVTTFERGGGLQCLFRWPDAFSMFSSEKNVADVVLDLGLF